MKYKTVKQASFIERPNRFNAVVSLNGERTTVHVKNTGRCRELLLPGSKVYLSKAENPQRKTGYDLVAVEKRREDGSIMLINMDSQLPNTVAAEWILKSGIFSENVVLRREVTYGKSRFDIYAEDGNRKAFIEVKGVTLEKDGVLMFPDAPTERGVKHLKELRAAAEAGIDATAAFVVQMEQVKFLSPNDVTHPAFGQALREAHAAGVNVRAFTCKVEPDSLVIAGEIPVIL